MSSSATPAPTGPESTAPPPVAARPRRRWRYLLQALNLVLLLVILWLFVVVSVQRQLWPVYGWVEGTPVEAWARRLPLIVRHRQAQLGNQARESPLLPDEQAQADELQQRLDKLRATHAVLLRDGRTCFGRLRQIPGRPGADYQLTVFNGRTFETLSLAESAIAWKKVMVYADVPLTPRDWRFLITYRAYNPYYLPPYLIVSATGFDRAQVLFLALSTLQDEFRDTFGALCTPVETTATIHVCYFPDRPTFLREATQLGDYNLVNSTGFFHRHDNCLYLCEDASAFPHTSPEHPASAPPDATAARQRSARLVRHEGTHQLSATLQLLPADDDLPFWVEEGLAQYGETVPFGLPTVERLAELRLAAAEHRLLPWPDLLALRTADRDTIAHANTGAAYAQAWLLFRHLMARHTRPVFFRYLLALQQTDWTNPAADPEHLLLNNLGTTASKLYTELDREVQELILTADPATSR